MNNMKMLSPDGVEEYLCQLQPETGDEELHIDLQALRKFDRAAAAILSASILGSFGGSNLIVRLPSKKKPRARILAHGLGFALTQRPGKTRLVPEGAAIELAQWRRSWSPGGHQLELFATLPTEPQPPNIVGGAHASWVNPHRAGATAGTAEVSKAISPWLSRLLPTYSKKNVSAHGKVFVRHIAQIASELVENTREHAPRTKNNELTHSLVQIAVTIGGPKGTDRLYLTVIDDGPGIAITARPKLLSVAPIIEQQDDAKLIQYLLEGRYIGWDQTRGFGLSGTWTRVKSWEGADITIATGPTRVRGRGGVLHSRQNLHHLEGTVVIVTFPLVPTAVVVEPDLEDYDRDIDLYTDPESSSDEGEDEE